MNSPIAYWRNQQQERELLDQSGTIATLTGQCELQRWQGIIQLKSKRVSGEIISENRKPQIGDRVQGVLRIREVDGDAGLVQYGVKFLLMTNE